MSCKLYITCNSFQEMPAGSYLEVFYLLWKMFVKKRSNHILLMHFSLVIIVNICSNTPFELALTSSVYNP